MAAMTARPVELFGTPIHPLTMDQALGVIDDVIARRERLLIAVVNAAKLVNMRKDRQLRESVLAADLTLADGQSIVWASRLLGCPLPERVAGIDLMVAMLARANARQHRVYFLGAEPEIVRKLVETVRRDFPQLVVAGSRDGYFGPADEEAVANDIAAARADILFVAMTSPKKENFLSRWSERIDVRVCHGVGGAFDVLAGKVRRAPRIWQRLGLEWLYRVVQEPRRMWKRYLVTNTIFLAWLARGLVSRLLPRGTGRPGPQSNPTR